MTPKDIDMVSDGRHTDVMELTPYVEQLHAGLLAAAEAAGAEGLQAVQRLLPAIDPTTRLVLLEALTAAAAEITGELAPTSVDVRLRGLDPEFVVTPSDALGDQRQSPPGAPPPVPAAPDDGGTSRTTLRLPEHLKLRVEQVAAREGLSVNAWLVRAVAEALDARGPGQSGRSVPSSGQRFTGWVH